LKNNIYIYKMNQLMIIVVALVVFVYFGGKYVPKVLKDNKKLILGLFGGLVLCTFMSKNVEGLCNSGECCNDLETRSAWAHSYMGALLDTDRYTWSVPEERAEAENRDSPGVLACESIDIEHGGRMEAPGEDGIINIKPRSEGTACDTYFHAEAPGGPWGNGTTWGRNKCDEYCGYCTQEEECVDNDAGLQEHTRNSPDTDGQGYTCSEYLSRGYDSPRNSESRSRCEEISEIESGLCCASCGE
jgi:hypothetical protein